MSSRSAFSNGASVGAIFGMIGAVTSLLAGPPAFVTILPTLAAGSILGGVAGGLIATGASMMVNAIPGMRYLVGEPHERPHPSSAAIRQQVQAIEGRQQSAAAGYQKREVYDHVQDESREWQDRIESEYNRDATIGR